MSAVIGIDPGPRTSGFVLFNGTEVVEAVEDYENEALVRRLRFYAPPPQCAALPAVVIERVQFYGKIMGPDVFDTIWYGGRFYQAAEGRGLVPHRVFWNEVRRQFVEAPRRDAEGKAKKVTEADVWLGLVKRFGGKEIAVGTRKSPGTLAHVKTHARSALALAIYWWDRASSAGVVPHMTGRGPDQPALEW